jgi:hypothetical protein
LAVTAFAGNGGHGRIADEASPEAGGGAPWRGDCRPG